MFGNVLGDLTDIVGPEIGDVEIMEAIEASSSCRMEHRSSLVPVITKEPRKSSLTHSQRQRLSKEIMLSQKTAAKGVNSKIISHPAREAELDPHKPKERNMEVQKLNSNQHIGATLVAVEHRIQLQTPISSNGIRPFTVRPVVAGDPDDSGGESEIEELPSGERIATFEYHYKKRQNVSTFTIRLLPTHARFFTVPMSLLFLLLHS